MSKEAVNLKQPSKLRGWVRHAWRETLHLLGLERPFQIFLRGMLAAAGVAVVYLWGSRGAGFDQALSVVVSVAVVALLVPVVFLWQFATTPYRTEREAARILLEEKRSLESRLIPTESKARTHYPDWPIDELFFHLRPDLFSSNESGGQNVCVWETVEQVFRDAAALDKLAVWGREFDEAGVDRVIFNSHNPPERIDAKYWRKANLTHNFYQSGQNLDRSHTYAKPGSGLPNYCDLRVNREEALALWPEPFPETDIRVDVELSGNGVEKVHEDSLVGVEKISIDEVDKRVVRVYFYRPIALSYTFTAISEGGTAILNPVHRPEYFEMRLTGGGSNTYRARIAVISIGSTKLLPFQRTWERAFANMKYGDAHDHPAHD